MKKKISMAAVAIILAFCLRLYAALNLPTDYDEPVYYTAARYYADAIRTGRLDQIPEIPFNYEHPLLAKIVYGAVLSILPSDGPLSDDVWEYFVPEEPLIQTRDPFRIFLLRLVSVFFGTLTVAVLALISPLAAIILAVHSLAIKYTSVIYLEALPACLTMASIGLFSASSGWIRKREKLSFGGQWKEISWLLVSALCLGAATACKYQYGIAGLAIFVFYLLWIIPCGPKDFARYALLAGFGMVALGSFIAADPYLHPAPLAKFITSTGFSLDYQGGGEVRNAGYSFYQPLTWLAQPVTAFVNHPNQPMPSNGSEFLFRLDSLFFVLGMIGLPRLYKNYPLFFTWLITGILFLLVWTTKWPQYSMLVVGPLCLSASEGAKSMVILLKLLLLKSSSNA